MKLTDEDQEWLRSRGPTGHEADVAAAIARGYERGHAEARAYVACAEAKLASALADRERLGEWCKELAAERDETCADPDRLAALEQRVGALVETLWKRYDEGIDGYEYRDRLAALRAPGEGAAWWIERFKEASELRRQSNAKLAAAESALATARRERDEAVGALLNVRAYGAVSDPCWCTAWGKAAGFDTPHGDNCLRARALVAGQGVAEDDGPPPMTPEMRARLEARQSSYARLDAEGRAAFDAYDGPVSCGPPSDLAARDAEIAGLKRERDAALEFHRSSSTERDTLRARVAELEARDREARGLLRRWMAPWGTASHSEHLEDIEKDTTAYLSGTVPPDPARGLIERCLDALDGRAMALRADLRAYLGGG